jgi:hypothetical protein
MDGSPAKSASKAQRNFTDLHSRLMGDGASKSFEQPYSAQAAVNKYCADRRWRYADP